MFKLLFNLVHQIHYQFHQFPPSVKEQCTFFFCNLKRYSSVQVIKRTYWRARPLKPNSRCPGFNSIELLCLLTNPSRTPSPCFYWKLFPCYFTCINETTHSERNHSEGVKKTVLLLVAMPEKLLLWLSVRYEFPKAWAGICKSGIFVFQYQKQ